MLAFAREGYSWRVVKVRELARTLAYPGLLRLARKHWRYGLGEVHRSLSPKAMVKQLQRMFPDIHASDLEHAGAGVRAQAVRRDGGLVDDFLFVQNDPAVLHVTNAPSPAATAALPIGAEIVRRLTGDRSPIRVVEVAAGWSAGLVVADHQAPLRGGAAQAAVGVAGIHLAGHDPVDRVVHRQVELVPLGQLVRGHGGLECPRRPCSSPT